MSRALPRLSAGDLRTRIEIMRQVQVSNGKGGFHGASWSVVAAVRAEVIGQNGREAVIALALQGVSAYRIRLRFRTDLLPSDQIRLGGAGGTDLNITSLSDPNGEREQLMIIASTASALKTS
jgi:SPP1 family predicted phage head-tail adaptor